MSDDPKKPDPLRTYLRPSFGLLCGLDPRSEFEQFKEKLPDIYKDKAIDASDPEAIYRLAFNLCKKEYPIGCNVQPWTPPKPPTEAQSRNREAFHAGASKLVQLEKDGAVRPVMTAGLAAQILKEKNSFGSDWEQYQRWYYQGGKQKGNEIDEIEKWGAKKWCLSHNGKLKPLNDIADILGGMRMISGVPPSALPDHTSQASERHYNPLAWAVREWVNEAGGFMDVFVFHLLPDHMRGPVEAISAAALQQNDAGMVILTPNDEPEQAADDPEAGILAAASISSYFSGSAATRLQRALREIGLSVPVRTTPKHLREAHKFLFDLPTLVSLRPGIPDHLLRFDEEGDGPRWAPGTFFGRSGYFRGYVSSVALGPQWEKGSKEAGPKLPALPSPMLPFDGLPPLPRTDPKP